MLETAAAAHSDRLDIDVAQGSASLYCMITASNRGTTAGPGVIIRQAGGGPGARAVWRPELLLPAPASSA